jgi:hypothetical protein
MRGSLVVLALALSPFVATVSKAQDPVPSSGTMPQCQKDPGNPSTSGDSSRTKKCPPPPPPTTGMATITGTVFFDLPPYDGVYDPNNEVGIAGWYVVLTGPSGSSNFLTDGSGFFSFAGLPSAATYTLCVQPSLGWTQTAPTSGAACTNSFGYTINVPPLAADSTIANQNFGFYSNTP